MASEATERKNSGYFRIPGATVRYKKSQIPFPFNFFSEKCDLVSISKGGLVFDVEKKLLPGTKVKLQLLIPDRAPIHLRGWIVWVGWQTYIRGDMSGAVSVQFMPFGSRRGNPNSVLEVLRELEDQYAKDVGVAGFNPVRDHLF